MRVLIVLLGLLIPGGITAQAEYSDQKERPPTMEELFSVKEIFRYEVKYGFFKLGWVEVKLLQDSLYNGKIRKHLFTEIRSNPRIPFMGTEINKYHSLFYVNEDGIPVTSIYWKDDIDENIYREIVYEFDRKAGKVYYKEEDNSRDTLDLKDPATAGHIIFYYSRLFAGSNQSFKLPVYVTKKAGFIYGNNSRAKEKREYAAFSKPIMAYELEGTTEDIEGPFGFSGDFRAWFLADDLRVPLEARVKVFLGNVIVKLIDYKREEL